MQPKRQENYLPYTRTDGGMMISIIKKLVEEQKLGHVFRIESRVHGSRGIPGDWRKEKVHGGGMVLDWGVHLLDQILYMYGDRKIETVYASLTNVTNQEVDDGFTAILIL